MSVHVYVCANNWSLFVDINWNTKPTSLKQLRPVVSKIGYCWHDIAIQLGFTNDQLDTINSAFSTRDHSVEDCCKAMFKWWKKDNKTVTTRNLIDAITEGAENPSFASKLEEG